MKVIVAVDSNWAIGNKGQLLASIPADQKNFRNETIYKTIVYGRKTLETFPHKVVLPKRNNIILSTKKDYKIKDAAVVHSRQELLDLVSDLNTDEVYIIGGESIYREFIGLCDTAIVTFIDKEFEADTYFPNLDKDPNWRMADESDEQSYFDLTYSYRIYKRVDSKY